MKSNLTKSATAAIIVIGAFIFLTQGNGASKAFANAMEHFAAAQTARFDLTMKFGEQEPQTSSFLYDAKGYIRQNMADGTVNFVDYNTNKVLSLLPGEKTAVIRDVREPDFHTALYDIFAKLQDLIQQAIDLGYGPVENLGTKDIDGRTAYGYRVETTGQSPGLFWQGKGTLTIWADTETDFPLVVRWYNTMTKITATVSNIELNVTFNPDEVAVTIPEDYTIADETLPPIEAKNEPQPAHTTQEDVVEPNSTPETILEEPLLNKASDPNIAKLIEGLNKNDQIIIKFFHSWTVLSKGKFPSSLTVDAIKDIDPEATIGFEQKLWSGEFYIYLPSLFGGVLKSDVDPNNFTKEEIAQVKEKKGPYYDALQNELEESLKEYKPLFRNIAEGFKFINELPAKSDWYYNGADVELSDSQTAIFWYRPKGSENYRVIFGDLTIEDMAPEDIPLLETFAAEDETDENAKEALEIAIQLGADIPEDKRATALRMLTLKEDDLIKGLATYLEFSGGAYPPTLHFDKTFVKHLDGFLNEAYKQQKIDKKAGESKTLDIGFAAFFYNKLTREKKEPAYYGDTMTIQDSDQILVRWKISKNKYRVIYGDLTRKTVSSEELANLEKTSEKVSP